MGETRLSNGTLPYHSRALFSTPKFRLCEIVAFLLV